MILYESKSLAISNNSGFNLRFYESRATPEVVAQVQEQGMTEAGQGPGLVLVLRPAFLSDHDQARRAMSEPDGGTGLVPLLAARPTGSVGVDIALRK